MPSAKGWSFIFRGEFSDWSEGAVFRGDSGSILLAPAPRPVEREIHPNFYSPYAEMERTGRFFRFFERRNLS